MEQRIYDTKNQPGLAILGDSTFVTMNVNQKIVKRRKTPEADDIQSKTGLVDVEVILQEVMLSEWQKCRLALSSSKRNVFFSQVLIVSGPKQEAGHYRPLCFSLLLALSTMLKGFKQVSTVYSNPEANVLAWIVMVLKEKG